MSDTPVISADSHVQEPPELYSERMDRRYRDRAPRFEERDGATYSIVDGKKPRRVDIAKERADEDDQDREFRNDPSGGRDIGRRLEDQERDGISAEVIYPNSSLFLYNSRDPGYQFAVARAYNDWGIELFGSHRDRFVPVAIVPVIDLDEAVREVERVAKAGYRSIKIPLMMESRPYNLPDYDRFWAACCDHGLVVSLHAFTESEDYYPEDWGEEEGHGGALVHMAMSMARGQNPVALLISSGALQRHPDLKFVVVECGAGWLAWLLHVLDEQVEKKHMWIRPRPGNETERVLPPPGRGDLQRRSRRPEAARFHRFGSPAVGQRLSPRRGDLPLQPAGHRADLRGRLRGRQAQDRLRERATDVRFRLTMHRTPMMMVVTSDLAGQVRGKGFPGEELGDRLGKGVGYTFTNHMINCWGAIAATPWGPLGDLVLMPDPSTEVKVDFGDGSLPEWFMLGRLLNMDGSPWDCCLRTYLETAVAELEDETGLTLVAAFEHEFHDGGMPERPGDSYSLEKVRLGGEFPGVFLHALRAAGAEPETFLPEFGRSQFEFTVKPAPAREAADRAIVAREMARASAWRLGRRVSFSPQVDPQGPGNGVHIHMSLRDADGRPVTHSRDGPGGLSRVAGSFVAGILRRLPAIVAVTAPSAASYQRLKPHSWSAAYNNLGWRDREAAVRICPVSDVPGADVADAFNVEFRAGDAAASPWLQLGVLVRAGLEGLREGLPAPEPASSDPDAMSDAERDRRGIVRLPTSLDAALDLLENGEGCRALLPGELFDAYVMHKRGELAALAGLDPPDICRRYAEVY